MKRKLPLWCWFSLGNLQSRPGKNGGNAQRSRPLPRLKLGCSPVCGTGKGGVSYSGGQREQLPLRDRSTSADSQATPAKGLRTRSKRCLGVCAETQTGLQEGKSGWISTGCLQEKWRNSEAHHFKNQFWLMNSQYPNVSWHPCPDLFHFFSM